MPLPPDGISVVDGRPLASAWRAAHDVGGIGADDVTLPSHSSLVLGSVPALTLQEWATITVFGSVGTEKEAFAPCDRY